MLQKADARRKWKNVKTEEGCRTYRRLDYELRREADRARKCNEMEVGSMIHVQDCRRDSTSRKEGEIIFLIGFQFLGSVIIIWTREKK